LITSDDQRDAQLEMRFAKIEATQRETSDLLEQLVVTMLADRQIPRGGRSAGPLGIRAIQVRG
jgi:hypothetical protein